MTTITELYHEIIRRRLWLFRDGTYLEIGPYPCAELDEAFVAEVRSRQKELLAFIESGRQVPVLAHLARQILGGEFGAIAGQQRESVIENFRQIRHPLCATTIVKIMEESRR